MTFSPSALPTFAQPAPVQAAPTFLAPPAAAPVPVAAAVPVPTAAGVVSADNPFAAMTGAKVWDNGAPRLPIWSTPYRVRIEKLGIANWRSGGRGLTIEFTVTESGNPDVPVGSRWGTMQGLSDTGMSYVLCWLCDVMGVDKSNKNIVAQVTAVCDAIMMAAVSGQTLQKNGASFEPTLILGKEVMVHVSVGGPKFNKESWSRLAA